MVSWPECPTANLFSRSREGYDNRDDILSSNMMQHLNTNERQWFGDSLKRSPWKRILGLIGLLVAMVFFWLNAWAMPASATDFDRVNLSNSDFHGQDLRGSSYTFTNLRNTDLSHTNLSGVSLFGSKFRGANLEGADLSYATLDSAELVDTNLNNANLEGAFAHSALFEGATIVGADFTDVDLRSDAQAMLCEIAEGTNPMTHRNTRDTLYCD